MPAASRPAYTASTTLVPDPQNRPRTRCPGWLYWVMMRCDEGHHGPTGAAWSGSSVPAVPPTPAGASHRPAARRYSPASSRHSSIRTAGLLAPLALRPAFPASLVGRYSHDYCVASPPANTSGFGVDPTIAGRGHALRTGPYPPGWSRLDSYGASPTGSLAFHLLVLLAEPGSSGSADPPRRCRGCFPPFPTFPGSGCPQLLPGCCDSPAVRSHTAHGFVRLVAHVLDVEAAQERVEQPQHVQVGRLGVGVPQPHRLRGPVTGQPVDSHQDQGAFHDRQRA